MAIIIWPVILWNKSKNCEVVHVDDSLVSFNQELEKTIEQSI